MATSGKYFASPGQILNEWTMEELIDAHLVLDMYEELEDKVAASAGHKP